jgi:hypothetical protein
MSELYQSLSHSKWECKYHVVFVPKRRCLGSAGNGEAAFPVSVDSAPSGRGFSRHWGLSSDDSCAVQCRQRESHEPQWSLRNLPFFFVSADHPFSSTNLAPGSSRIDDCQLGRPGASPVFRFLGDHRGMSSRAIEHRLDEPRQVIPQHGCVPAVPASVSPGKLILTPLRQAADACCRRSCRC